MKRILILLVMSLVCTLTHAETSRYPWGKTYMFRLYLTDKKGTPGTLRYPEMYLSQKSLERRKRQHLSVDSTDLPLSAYYLKQIRMMGATVMCQSKWNNTVVVRTADSAMVSQFSQLPFVSRVVHVWTAPDTLKPVTRENVVPQMNTSSRVEEKYYGNAGSQIGLLNGKPLHDMGFRGQGMTIAVLDGGFQNCNEIPALQRANIVGGKNFVWSPESRGQAPDIRMLRSGEPLPEILFRETDHGTKVLSTMATDEPQILVGTAPEARYWLLRSEDQHSEQPVEEDYWTMAAEFADSAGVDIISSSLGYSNYDGTDNDYRQRDLDGRTALISRSASMLAQKGIILVSSAGNAGMGPWKKIEVPGDASDILTVGALNRQKENAPFSGVGPTQDGRVKPDVMALGSPAVLISGRGTIVRDMGTSFSTPIVAGLVACLWQALPEKTAFDIIALVRQTASQHDQPDNIYGYGTPNFWRAYMIGKVEVSGER